MFMCLMRKSGPGREYSIAIDWHDCAWSPLILVQFPVAASVRLERGCVQNTSRSTLKSSAASGVFQQVWFARRLWLIPLSGTQPRSGAVPNCTPNYLAI
jgi:hypothetical protein